jgi:hypothetical protein
MFAGIICACMPSAAQTARQHKPTYEWLLLGLSARFTSFKSTLFGSNYATDSQYSVQKTEEADSNSETDMLRSTVPKFHPYFNLNEISTTEGSLDWNSNPVTTTTEISSEKTSNAV